MTVELRGVSIRMACRIFGISESCFRYREKLRAGNDAIPTGTLSTTVMPGLLPDMPAEANPPTIRDGCT